MVFHIGGTYIQKYSDYYVCNTYKKKGPEYCSAHYIRRDELYDAVLNDIQKIIAAIYKNKDACIKRIAKKLGADNGSRNSEYRKNN